MLRVSHHLGNIHQDSDLAAQVTRWEHAHQLEEVTLNEREAQKSRLRLQTSTGQELGLVLPRGTETTDGDIFAFTDREGGLLVHLALQEVMVLTLHPGLPLGEQHHWLVRLGHVLGNQHWPVASVNDAVLVPVSLDRAVMETVLRTHHLLDQFTVRYERRSWPKAALQLTDSFFPSGTVTLSHGLETFLGGQSAEIDLSQLLQDYLERKIAPCDLVAYAHAYRAAEEGDVERLHQLDRYLNVSLLPQELRQGSARSGRATLETLRRLVEEPLFQAFLAGIEAGKSSGHISICLGLLHVLWRIPQRRGGAMLLYTFMVNFLGAAIRLGCLGHREAQRLLINFRPHLIPLADQALESPLEEIGTFVPLADIRAMQHAHLSVRLFSS